MKRINPNNPIYKNDLRNGNLNEIKVLKYLNDNIYQDCPLEKSKNKYDYFDFFSRDAMVELKSRTNPYSQYPTTMVGLNKIQFVERELQSLSESVLTTPEFKFMFLFTDGLYEWTYAPEEYSINTGFRNDRGVKEEKKYAYIHISKLKLVTKDINSKN
tara:strand:- start:2629 stop:3102 length:474 start_codon:yes stop_codon:yes gene_type:complete